MDDSLAAHRERLEALRREVHVMSRTANIAKARLREWSEEQASGGEQLRDLLAALPQLSGPEARQNVAGAETTQDASESYARVVADLQSQVAACVPRGAVVAVVSRGDPALVSFDGREGWHFPQSAHGIYAGHHPADSDWAIGHLEVLRARGAAYLAFPRTALWWLDHYVEFAQHLNRVARRACVTDSCVIYRLETPLGGGPAGRVWRRIRRGRGHPR